HHQRHQRRCAGDNNQSHPLTPLYHTYKTPLRIQNSMNEDVYFYCPFGPTPPKNTDRPSVNVSVVPFARWLPSRARWPCTITSVPTGSEFFVNPRRNSMLAPPELISQVSVLPSAVLTSIVSQQCGLVHSIFFTIPCSLTGLVRSNSVVIE